MKKYLLFAFVAVMLSACGKQATFKICGSVDGTDKVYLLDSRRNVIDSVGVKNGKFKLERTFVEPMRCYISEDDDEEDEDEDEEDEDEEDEDEDEEELCR